MKKVLSSLKASVILLLATVIAIGFSAYMLLRPISYGMDYHNETVYEGAVFEGSMTFYRDGRMANRNTNFDGEMMSYYYYKNGYIFFTLADTEEAYEEEVCYIDEHFEEAVESPFYAAKNNAFRSLLVGPDGYSTVYTCNAAYVFAAVAGAVVLVLLSLTCVSFILRKKACA